jgi:hypothetical protein
MKYLIFFFSHSAILAIGFALGIYLLPIITAPKPAAISEIEKLSSNVIYQTEFKKGQRGNDFLHWGEGKVMITNSEIIFKGKIAPGPDYKIYLTKKYVEHEDEFLPIKSKAVFISDLKNFENFIIPINSNINFSEYNTIIIWCEAFKEFITSAKYQ